MILLLATRYRRAAALLLFFLFYSSLVLPNVAGALAPVNYYRVAGIPVSGKEVRTGFPFVVNGREEQKAEKSFTTKGLENIQKKSGKAKKFIGGPGQPEMSSFKSVNASDMVDLFTGDFSYNIPLMDVGGYPVNLHYNSGISMDQEASWVGLGWNINPGTISRSMRGLPDDFNGTDTIRKTQYIKENKTVGVSVTPDVEIVGTPVNLSATKGVFHNNYKGYGIEQGINASIGAGSKAAGPLSGSLSISNNSQTGIDIRPNLKITLANKDQSENARSVSLGLTTNFNSRAGMSALQLNAEVRATTYKLREVLGIRKLIGAGTSFPTSADISFAIPSYTPTISMPLTSTQFSFSGKIGREHYAIHPSTIAIQGYVSKQEIKEEDVDQAVPAVGYLYYTRSNGRSNTLMDVNREKELTFNSKTTPHIAIPQYTYDIYSISGEGTGGMFRPYRGDVGYVRDYTLRTKSESDRFSIDLGFGSIFHGGVDFAYTNAYTENGSWNGNNNINQYIKFRENDSTYQAVYFRNPGEKTSNTQSFYKSAGDDALIRVKLDGKGKDVHAANSFVAYKNAQATGEIAVNNAITKKERDKRMQVITYLTAAEARLFGLDSQIVSYPENSIPVGNCGSAVTAYPRVDDSLRKPHHLSEISVLNGDGRRYVYGLPAYNVMQEDVTFAVQKEAGSDNLDKGLVKYTPDLENSLKNDKGKDHYYTREKTPGYAHSFLLTGILSPDYVDIKGDGITEDDRGDAVKFNYSQVYGAANGYFEWRTPQEANKANYSEGLKTYDRDDKGTYLHGKKEVWYLHSVESKTMIALFRTANDRKDNFSVRGENGVINLQKPLRRLERIDLYVKSDLLKNGANARPVKTTFFSYNYSLCTGITGDSRIGKLTLESVWFSYNGNNKGKKNPYVFQYHPGTPASNPGYHPKHYDRWGNYKSPAANPGGLNNSDYPYAVQDSVKAAQNATAWNLSDIRLPSGGRMRVTYESDDYAYVQNKRATQFFQLAGISNNAQTVSGDDLYNYNYLINSFSDHYYVFVKSPVTLKDKSDVQEKFLSGSDYIYFKIAVKMKTDRWGGGVEMVPVYAKVADYGLASGSNHLFWIRLQATEGESPLARSAVQFLRLNLPSKAYPTSEMGDDINVWDAVKILASGITEIKTMINGFGKDIRNRGLCKSVNLSQSFVRLANPAYKKYGGGHRVKRIEIFDNWNKMTGQKEAVYGQEYQYQTSEEINGKRIMTSSGVATYEPMIGAEENPFRQPIEYAEKTAPMAPVNDLFSEHPLGESYYPSAMVGYGRMRVRTINRAAKSANGWQETEFYTSKDFPTIVEHTLLDDEAKKRYNPKLNSLLKLDVKNYISISQGFRIELNDMNGKVKSQSSYAETDSLHPISYVYNYYKVDDDKAYQKHLNNTVWVADSVNGHINTEGQMGKDIELMVDMREQVSRTIAGNHSANLDIVPGFGFIPFIPIPSMLPLPQKEEVRFRSAATVKIVQRYGILDSVVAMDKGSIVSTKNLVYDGETGEVLLSRTANEFNDPIYNFSYPAHWAYSGMGMAYKNMDAVFSHLKLINGKLYYGGAGTTPFPVEKYFESGDEILITGDQLGADPANCLSLLYEALPKRMFQKVWAIDASKGKEQHQGIYFIDGDGKPVSGQVGYMRILRSGKRNLLDAGVGSIVTLANPVKQVSPGNYRLIFDSTSRVINASAVTYKDLWQVENSLYAKDTVIRVYKDFPALYLRPRVNVLRLDIKGTGEIQVDEHIDTLKYIASSYDLIPSRACVRSRHLSTKSILNFDLSTLPPEAIVIGAMLNFAPKVPKHLWEQRKSGKSNFTCPNTYSYDWSKATDFHYNASAVNIKRITAPWNSSTPYQSYQTTSQNQVPVDFTNYTALNCTSLAQDLVRNPNYGLMFELIKNYATGEDYQTNYLSFCSEKEYNVNIPYCTNTDYNKVNSINTKADYKFQMDCDCSDATLQIFYKAFVDSVITVCRENISDTSVNPYRWGILGNWRTDKTYTYYHDRKESDASTAQTDIRKEGELKSFAPYWKFTGTALTAGTDPGKWVWNSASSAYNRKGYETENYDPLGRYNSGLYGYLHTVPVAVVQNSRYREVLFDGFEDYGYQTTGCTTCVARRDVDFVMGNAGVSTSRAVSHTGRFSLKVDAGAEARIAVPIIPRESDAAGSLSLKVDSTPVYTQYVVGKGQGLTGYYYGYPESECTSDLFFRKKTLFQTVVQGPIQYSWGRSAPAPGMCYKNYEIKWYGKIQADQTDKYNFSVSSGGTMEVTIKDQQGNIMGIGALPVHLEAGKLYDIEVRYNYSSISSFNKSSEAHLYWTKSDGIKTIVPKNFLYPTTITAADTAGSVIRNIKHYCISLKNPKPQNIIRPAFSPLQSSRLVVSAWLRTGDDPNTTPAPDDVIRATVVHPNATTSVALQKTGTRIEGWQRYESVVDIPSGAHELKLSIHGVQNRTVFVDDIRVQPFNSGMKNYVYDPTNLRLMADLDENNYGAFYEYDDDGTLIRVKKETERGIMTVKETRSAMAEE